MTKQEFVNAVSDRSGLSRSEAGKAVDAVLETITDTLKKRDSINFTGFGKFATSERKARMGVNPRDPSPESAHSGGDGPEVHRRQLAQAVGSGRLGRTHLLRVGRCIHLRRGRCERGPSHLV